MKHLTTADGSLLIGDEATDLLVADAALTAQLRRGDHVTLHAAGGDAVPHPIAGQASDEDRF